MLACLGNAQACKGEPQIDCREVIELLKENVPTEAELKRRREFYDKMAEFRAKAPPSPGPFPSTEEMIREDRER